MEQNNVGGQEPQEVAEFTAEELEIIEASNYGDLDIWRAAKELGIDFNTVEEAYNGEWRSDEEFVQDLLESCGDMPKDLPHYIHIDWESTARDVMMDYSEENGHYFRNL